MSLIAAGSDAWDALTRRALAIEDELRNLTVTSTAEPAAVRRTWLHRQWDHLEQVDPQIDLPYRGTLPTATSRQLIDPTHIVDVTGAGHRWGELPTHPAAFEQLLEALQDAAALHRCDHWIESIARPNDLIQLRAEAGPLGPLYASGGQGRRRAMLAKALQLPVLDVALTTRPLPSPVAPVRWPAMYMPDDDWTVRYYCRLVDEGLIAVHQEQTPSGGEVVITPLVQVDASWIFDPPRLLAATTATYRRHYPDFRGLTPDTGRLAQEAHRPRQILSGKKARWTDSRLGGWKAR